MPKIITIDNAVVTLVRITTDLGGAIHVFADFALNSGPTPIQMLSQEITSQLSPGDQSTALAVFASVLQAVSALEGIPVTGPVPPGPSQNVAPAPRQPPSRTGSPTSSR
jgi:hypothetical protein